MSALESGALTVVMYHYVRPIAGSRHPNIKGLELAAFGGQLAYIAQHYQFVTTRQIIESVRTGAPLPARPALLTFDDGYADHRHHVLPVLKRRGITGAFFPPSCAALHRQMLDVNKVHFILASAHDSDALVQIMESRINERRQEFGLATCAAYRSAYYAPTRFDPASVIYLKRMLQRGLPVELRHAIADEMFRRFVTEDEPAFVDELYLDVHDLQEMAADGMEIGSHGHSHQWLESLDACAQEADIEQSLRLLDEVGLPRRDFLFCYPYGSHNDTTLRILEAKGCGAAFTTQLGLASLSPAALLKLPRLDTNDLPTDGAALPNHWTHQAVSGPLSA
jgi:peptidoglycan/xylan/chitin deacetylase (PgdA/CDA1 family)